MSFGIQALVNGLMRAAERDFLSSNRRNRIRYSSELLSGNAQSGRTSPITGGTAGFPVPERRGRFFVFGGNHVSFNKTMATKVYLFEKIICFNI